MLINILRELNAFRYHGGWTKIITDKEFTPVTVHTGLNNLEDGLYINSNRNSNGTSDYTIFFITKNTFKILYKQRGPSEQDVQLQGSIKRCRNIYYVHNSPLVNFLVAELELEIAKRKGLA